MSFSHSDPWLLQFESRPRRDSSGDKASLVDGGFFFPQIFYCLHDLTYTTVSSELYHLRSDFSRHKFELGSIRKKRSKLLFQVVDLLKFLFVLARGVEFRFVGKELALYTCRGIFGPTDQPKQQR